MKEMSSPFSRKSPPSREPSFCNSAQPWLPATSISSSLPGELDGVAVAGAMDRPSEAIESELTAVVVEQDKGSQHGQIVAGGLDDAPSALDPHAGTTRSLGRRIRL